MYKWLRARLLKSELKQHVSAGELSAADWKHEREYWQNVLFAKYRNQYGVEPVSLQSSDIIVPPRELITSIQGASKSNPDTFFGTAYRQAFLYLEELDLLQSDPRRLGSIFEFGVGFGRLLTQFLPFDVPLSGCDVTPEVIDWARSKLPLQIDLSITSVEPPLPYDSDAMVFEDARDDTQQE